MTPKTQPASLSARQPGLRLETIQQRGIQPSWLPVHSLPPPVTFVPSLNRASSRLSCVKPACAALLAAAAQTDDMGEQQMPEPPSESQEPTTQIGDVAVESADVAAKPADSTATHSNGSSGTPDTIAAADSPAAATAQSAQSASRKRRVGPHYTKARESCIKYTGQIPDVSTISAHELLRLKAAGQKLVLIDVRLPEEQEVSVIAGAISQDEFERADKRTQYDPNALLNATIVPYCTIGFRSGLYARKLKALGYANVKNGEGIVMWTHDVGNGLVDPEGAETRRVHVYGECD